MKNYIIFAALLILFPLTLPGQDCAVKLRDAENLFNAGLLEEVPGLLADCLESGFNKAEELSAYQLIIRSYLYEDKIELAEQTMLEFLKKNPEYELSPTDNADFVYLFNKFSVRPRLQLSANLGSNLTFVSLISEHSTSGTPQGKKYSNEQMSFAAGLEAKIRISPAFEVGTGLDYSQVSFSVSEDLLEYTTATSPERQTRLEVPVLAYWIPMEVKGFSPYARAGAAGSFNISTLASQSNDNIDVNSTGGKEGKDEDKTASRSFFEVQPVIGVGARYKLPRSYISFDISGRLATTNQAQPGDLKNSDWFYLISDDYFSINNIRFNIGYTFIFYKPEKIEK